MKTQSLAVAGLGSFTQRVLLPGLLACDSVRVVAAFTRSQARAQEMQAQHSGLPIHTDYLRMLDAAAPDIVLVGSPNAAHVPMVVEAAQRGCHVICEKPLAPTLRGAEEMAAAAKDAGVRTAVNFTFRSIGAARYAKHLLAQGRIGRIAHVALLYLQDIRHGAERPKVWRMDAEVAGAGALGDVGSHAIDLVRWWCGEFAAVCRAHLYPQHGAAGRCRHQRRYRGLSCATHVRTAGDAAHQPGGRGAFQLAACGGLRGEGQLALHRGTRHGAQGAARLPRRDWLYGVSRYPPSLRLPMKHSRPTARGGWWAPSSVRTSSRTLPTDSRRSV